MEGELRAKGNLRYHVARALAVTTIFSRMLLAMYYSPWPTRSNTDTSHHRRKPLVVREGHPDVGFAFPRAKAVDGRICPRFDTIRQGLAHVTQGLLRDLLARYLTIGRSHSRIEHAGSALVEDRDDQLHSLAQFLGAAPHSLEGSYVIICRRGATRGNVRFLGQNRRYLAQRCILYQRGE